MDNQTRSMEVFLDSLTEEQVDTCERDEKQLAEIFDAGWSEETAVLFHRAMLCARRVNPNETNVSGVFETAFRLGLEILGNDAGRTGGSVHMDGATIVRVKPKRPYGWKKGQARGV